MITHNVSGPGTLPTVQTYALSDVGLDLVRLDLNGRQDGNLVDFVPAMARDLARALIAAADDADRVRAAAVYHA